MRLAPRLTCVDRLVFESPLVCIGRFECPRQHALFRDSGPASAHLFVFPRTQVRIVRRDRAAFTTSPGVVTFYNPGDEYTRVAVGGEGDHCDWFAVSDEIAAAGRRELGATPQSHRGQAFPFASGPADAALYLEQRLTVARAARPHADALAVEEAVMGLLQRALDGAGGAAAEPELRPAEIERVEATRAVLAAELAAPLSLAAMAEAVGIPVFSLCRLFRRGTGHSLHGYRHQLRLRRALELVAAAENDLTGVALGLGFSSHSHFTQAFRVAYGVTPTEFRRRLGAPGRGRAHEAP